MFLIRWARTGRARARAARAEAQEIEKNRLESIRPVDSRALFGRNDSDQKVVDSENGGVEYTAQHLKIRWL